MTESRALMFGCALSSLTVSASAVSFATTRRPHADALQPASCLAAIRSHPLESVPVSIQRADKGALVVARVCIDEHGPFRFLVDTGASESVVATPLARLLDLGRAGATRPAAGLCRAEVTPVNVRTWSLSGIRLAGQRLVSAPLPVVGGQRIDGLIGSDVLSRFGAVRIDYSRRRLTLATPEAKAPGPTAVSAVSGPRGSLPSGLARGVRLGAPLTVITEFGSVFATVVVTFHGLRTSMVVDTGAAISGLTPPTIAAAHLGPARPRLRLQGVGCSATLPTVSSGAWALAGRRLPGQPIVRLPTGAAGMSAQGLLGSDVLRRTGAVVIDYRDARLVLEAG